MFETDLKPKYVFCDLPYFLSQLLSATIPTCSTRYSITLNLFSTIYSVYYQPHISSIFSFSPTQHSYHSSVH